MTITLDYPWLDQAWQAFSNAAVSGRIPHAILCSGIKGVGKYQLSITMAKKLLCEHDETEFACGQCHSCQLFQAESHPDFTRVSPEEPGKAIRVDQIRELIASQHLKSKVSQYKVVLITELDSLNINAFNSLLKLLEEPQADTVLILISTNIIQLPITIRSRCQNMPISPPSDNLAIDWLNRSDATEPAIGWSKCLKLVNGAPLAAMTLDNASLGVVDEVEADFKLLLSGRGNVVQLAQKWQQFDMHTLFSYLAEINLAEIKRMLSQGNLADVRSIEQIWHISDCIQSSIKLISSSNNVNKTLLIEDFMVSVIQTH